MTDTDSERTTEADRTERNRRDDRHDSDRIEGDRTDSDRTEGPTGSDRTDDECDATGRPRGRYAGRTTPTPRSGRRATHASAVSEDGDRADDVDDLAGDGFARIDRREYLGALGAAGSATAVGSLAGAATGTAAAQEDWEAAAEDRIQEHRTGDLEVVVEDDAGTPVSDADVEVEMQEHDFGFGVAVHAEFLTNGTEWGDPIEGLDESDQQRYAETIEELFNEIVLENLHKWNLWEDNTDIADEAVDWALERDMDVRGHVCLWGNVGAWAVPPDVVEAMGVEWPDGPDEYEAPDHDPEYVREESMAHLEEIIDYYGDQITEWDVVNEVFHQPAMIHAIEGEDVTPETAPILGDWYERAQEVAGEYDVGIATNDYNTLNGPIGNARERYETQLQYLVEERGIDLDGVGLQGHFRQRTGELSPEQILEALDRYSGYGAGIRCTEFDVFQGDWTDEGQAEYLHRFLKQFYSHPNTDDFLVWGHWTPLHWGDDYGGEEQNAPFYREDWTEKPALESYRNLVHDEWWTSESGSTDADGTYATSAFLGEHEVTATIDGETATETVSVTDPDGTTQVVVSSGGTPTSPTSPADQWTNEVTASTIEMGWESVDAADQYVVYLDGEEMERTSQTTSTLGGLESGTTYTIGLASANDVGESDVVETDVTTIDGPACEGAADSETLEDGSTVCDVDGDGEYRDVTGDGSVTNSDVTEFFGNQHADPWDSRADLFDFTGDDDVTQADVIELFSSL